LATYLTEIERNFIELRLSEEQAALRYLDQGLGHDAQGAFKPDLVNQPLE